jgi:hypothetical protein
LQLKIKLGSYQITGHRPGKPLKEGDSGFVNFPVKIENTTARANRANREMRANLRQEAPERPATPLDEREVIQRPVVEKSVISVKKNTERLQNAQSFVVRRVEGEKFSVSPFQPKRGATAASLNGNSLYVSDLKKNKPELFAEMQLDQPENEARFRAEFASFILDAKKLFRDPQLVAEALRPINDEVGRHLGWNENDYAGVDTLVVGDNGVMLPNYANIKPLPEKKNQVLSEVLLESEAAHGINRDVNHVPLFDGFIDNSVADRFVAEGHLFGENENRVAFMMHGTYSHRLQWECIRQWVESGRLQAPAALAHSSGSGTDFNKLLAAIIYVKPKAAIKDSRITLWGKLVDSAEDARRNGDDAVADFRADALEEGMSCLAPNLMMTTIKCFGDTLGLQHLQKYLNDSSVKRLRKLEVIDRSETEFQTNGDLQIKDHIGDQGVFGRLAFLLNADSPPRLPPLPFTLPKVGREDEMYDALPPEKRKAAEAFVEGQNKKYSGRGPAPTPQPTPSSAAQQTGGSSAQPAARHSAAPAAGPSEPSSAGRSAGPVGGSSGAVDTNPSIRSAGDAPPGRE